MGKLISIALFALLAEAGQMWIYSALAAPDLAKVGLLGPLAGALAGAAVASFLNQVWQRLPRLQRSVIFSSIVVLFSSAGTTYYQRYAEQITHDARVLHPLAAYTDGPWGGDPWMMYPGLGNAGIGTGCQRLMSDVGASLVSTLEASFLWLPVVILICWFTRKPATPRRQAVRGALPA
jgi:hypothetical protein